MMPEAVGFSSENAAHRIAVLWDDEQGVTREGVFIPRRDTNSPVNYLLVDASFLVSTTAPSLTCSIQIASWPCRCGRSTGR